MPRTRGRYVSKSVLVTLKEHTSVNNVFSGRLAELHVKKDSTGKWSFTAPWCTKCQFGKCICYVGKIKDCSLNHGKERSIACSRACRWGLPSASMAVIVIHLEPFQLRFSFDHTSWNMFCPGDVVSMFSTATRNCTPNPFPIGQSSLTMPARHLMACRPNPWPKQKE